MRILITTPAGLGHVHPMVPLARAAVARGHEVLWAAAPNEVAAVEAAGLRAVPAGIPTRDRHDEFARRHPEVKELSPSEVPQVMFASIFGEIAAPAMFADLAPFAFDWRPDLVLADAGEFAGHVLAAELGMPSVTKGFGPFLPEARVARITDAVAPLWRSRGLEPRPYGGCYDHLYLDIYPPGLQPATVEHVVRRQLLRPVPYDGETDADTQPLLPSGRPDAPLVYVTMGTVFNDPEPLRQTVAALAALPVRILATVGPAADPDALGPQPDHVRVERYVPQTVVFDHCDVVVSHAGSGTVLAALGKGLPQLCLPRGADQFLNGTAVADVGAGLSLPPDAASADGIATAVTTLLDDVAYRDAARAVSRAIAAMPSPDDVIEVLERLADV